MHNMTLDEEMELWKARDNDEFGKILRKIEKLATPYLYTWEEMGIEYSPISEYITMYSLDGNRKWVAQHIEVVLENYDILGNHRNIKTLVNKLFKLI